MRSSRKIFAACCLAWAAGCALAFAQPQLLAERELKCGGKICNAQLWGEVMTGNYATELLLLLKDKEKGQLVTAYRPDITGGYGCRLEAVTVTGQGEQLLVTVQQGNWRRPRAVRLYDLSRPEKVRVLFDARCNLGLTRRIFLNKAKSLLTVVTASGDEAGTAVEKAEWEGGLEQAAQWSGLDSAVPLDTDGDGMAELVTAETISYGDKAIAKLGAVWHFSKESEAAAVSPKEGSSAERKKDEAAVEPQKGTQEPAAEAVAEKAEPPQEALLLWQRENVRLAPAEPKKRDDRSGEGCKTKFYRVWPDTVILPVAEVTLPVITAADAALQNKLNAALGKHTQKLRQRSAEGKEMKATFQVLTATPAVLSIELSRSDGEKVSRHYVNLDPQKGGELSLKAFLKTEDKKLLPHLAALSADSTVDLSRGLPAKWFIAEGDKLCFVAAAADGEEEAVCFTREQLGKFLRPGFFDAEQKQ